MADPRRRAGFTLFEALVALVVAGLLLPALGRALSGAWSAARTPMEIVSAVTLARDAAADLGPGDVRGYRVVRTSAPLDLEELPSGLPPAPSKPAANSPGGLDPDAVPAGMRLAAPKGLKPGAVSGGGPAAAGLRHVVVTVTTPSGRRIGLDAIALDAPRR